MTAPSRLGLHLIDRQRARPWLVRARAPVFWASLFGLLAGCSALDRSGTDGESSFVTAGGRTQPGSVLSPGETDADFSGASDNEETRPAPATESEPDADAGSQLTMVGAWTNDLAPESCVTQLSNPIEGCDPSVNPTWDLDCDEDGVPDHVAYACDPTNTERGPAFSGPYDCAPENPRLAIWVAPDSDDDGIPGSGEFNCSPQEIPAGYIALSSDSPQDCDDSAATVYPGAPDPWGDDIDADCSGSDYPNCGVLTGGGPIETVVTRDSACQTGVDLQLVEPVFCGDRCRTRGTLYFFVVNAAAVDSAAEIKVTWNDDTGAKGETLLPALAAGGASALVPVSFDGATEVTVNVENEDCDTTNNTQVFAAGGDRPCLF